MQAVVRIVVAFVVVVLLLLVVLAVQLIICSPRRTEVRTGKESRPATTLRRT